MVIKQIFIVVPKSKLLRKNCFLIEFHFARNTRMYYNMIRSNFITENRSICCSLHIVRLGALPHLSLSLSLSFPLPRIVTTSALEITQSGVSERKNSFIKISFDAHNRIHMYVSESRPTIYTHRNIRNALLLSSFMSLYLALLIRTQNSNISLLVESRFFSLTHILHSMLSGYAFTSPT